MSQSPDDLTFSIDSRLLEELGENLVTRNHVAVAELIKNAYDADATDVNLKFINARQNKDHTSEIRISDNGTGMTYEEIDENWMRIGTTDKIRHPKTKTYGRNKTGNKGIGRFSARRLGYRLELTAIAEDPDSDGYIKSYVEFPWDEFARDTDVDEIPVPSEVTYPDEAETGVTLRILNLRDQWTQRDFDTLRRNVLTLSVVQQQRREGYKEDPGFSISFDAPEFDQGQGSLLEQVYEAGWCVLEGRFDNEGNVHLEIEAKKIGEREYTLRKDYDGIEGTSFKIAFIPKAKEHFRDTSTLSLEKASEITSDYGGIRVYKDGFRVYPYGGPNDDWLGIDRYVTRRIGRPEEEFDELSGDLELHRSYDRTMLIHPRNENLIGRINVDSGANLQMKTDREGFIQNSSFDELKDGIRLSLQWLTLQYSNYQALQKKEELSEKAREFKNQLDNKESDESDDSKSSGLSDWNSSSGSSTGSSGSSTSSSSTSSRSSSSYGSSSGSDTLNQAVSVIETASETINEDVGEEGEDFSETVESATEYVKTSVEQKQEEIDFYRSAFSVNQFVFSFMHELRDVILDLETTKGDIKRSAQDLPTDKREELLELSEGINELQSRFKQQMDLFGILTDSGESTEQSKQRISKEVDKLTKSVAYISTEYNVSIESDIPPNLYTPPMYQTELYSILINLLTNSIKAVIADNSKKGQILIEAYKSGDDVVIKVSDTGIGIPKDSTGELFEPLVSDPNDELYDNLEDEMPDDLSSQLGSGSGLGLNIVRDIAEKYGGNVEFTDKDGWNTTVEVILRDE